MKPNTALLMIDLQNDFCPGGQLAVPHGDEVIVLANRLQPLFNLVIATKDWHPANHVSFAANHWNSSVGNVVEVKGCQQILWPIHCVQGSVGAEFHPALQTDKINRIVYKGMDPLIDSYSAFYDNEHGRATGLADYLHDHHVDTVYVMGLATEYCVKYSCLDAAALGFRVMMIENACRGVALHTGDVSASIEEVKNRDVNLISMEDIIL